jgi:hypothetical protein
MCFQKIRKGNRVMKLQKNQYFLSFIFALGLTICCIAFCSSSGSAKTNLLSKKQLGTIYGGIVCETLDNTPGCSGNVINSTNYEPDCGGAKDFSFEGKRDNETYEQFSQRYLASIPICDSGRETEFLGDASAQGADAEDNGESMCHYKWPCTRSSVVENARAQNGVCVRDDNVTTHCVVCNAGGPAITGEPKMKCPEGG